MSPSVGIRVAVQREGAVPFLRTGVNGKSELAMVSDQSGNNRVIHITKMSAHQRENGVPGKTVKQLWARFAYGESRVFGVRQPSNHPHLHPRQLPLWPHGVSGGCNENLHRKSHHSLNVNSYDTGMNTLPQGPVPEFPNGCPILTVLPGLGYCHSHLTDDRTAGPKSYRNRLPES